MGEKPPVKISDKLLLTGPELAETLGLSLPTIYKLENEGAFPAKIKIGKSTRWYVKDVEEWIEEQRDNAAYIPNFMK